MSKESNTTNFHADEAPSPPRRTAGLRRWSVAELIARALAPAPADRISGDYAAR